MAKLFFRYGTTGAGKSIDLIRIAYNYEEHGVNVLILTSEIDDRYGSSIVKSRTGISKDALSVTEEDDLFKIAEYKKTMIQIGCVLVDEVQFFTKKQIYELADIVDQLGIPVICYGLKGDFKLQSFDTTATLMTICDEIEEIKTICSHCVNKKAVVSARYVNDVVVVTGKQVEIGGNEKYKPLCRGCWNKLVKS